MTPVEPHRYQADAAATEARIARYDAYTAHNILTGHGSFVCQSQQSCRQAFTTGSVDHPESAFYEGQLGYIGPHYDLKVDDHPWRMLILGIELGGSALFGPPRLVDRGRRSRHHELAVRFGAQNPHMRGVVMALRYLLGLGVDADETSTFIDLPDVGRTHILECYALMNARLCSLIANAGQMTSLGIPEVTRNCFQHLRAVIEILEPTVVVVQGVQTWKMISSLVTEDCRNGEPVPAHRAKVGDWETTFVHLSHPSARGRYRWSAPSDRYFNDTVMPALQYAVTEAIRSER